MLTRTRKYMSNILNRVGLCTSHLCTFTTKKTLAMAGVFYAKTFGLSQLLGNPDDPATSISWNAKTVVAAIDVSMLLIFYYYILKKKQREYRDNLKSKFLERYSYTLSLMDERCIRNAAKIKEYLNKEMNAIIEIDKLGESRNRQCCDFSFGFMHSAALYAGSNLACILYFNAIDYPLTAIANGGFAFSLLSAVMAAYYEEKAVLNKSDLLSEEVQQLYDKINAKLKPKHTKNRSSAATVAAALSMTPKRFLSPTATSSEAISIATSPDATAHLLSPQQTSSPHPSLFQLPRLPTLQDINSRGDVREVVIDIRKLPSYLPGLVE